MEAKFGREQDAIRYYDAAIKTSPTCLPAVHGLRDLYRRREEWPRVIETLELEVKLWSDDKERAGVFAQIGRIYEKQLGDPERAHALLRERARGRSRLPAREPGAVRALLRSAASGTRRCRSRARSRRRRCATAIRRTRSEFYRKRGVVARMTGDPKAAADSFVVALEIKPTNTAALDDLGALAREQPDVWDFDATYRELEKVYKKRDDAGALLARVHVGARRDRRARRRSRCRGRAVPRRRSSSRRPTSTILSALVDFHADMRHWTAGDRRDPEVRRRPARRRSTGSPR